MNNMIASREGFRLIPNAFICADCGASCKKLYAKMGSVKTGKWSYNETMKGVCKKCIEI